jgi:phosphohistidine phosphatase
MRTLYLLRHAKSSWQDESLADFDRPLKKRGKEAAKQVGKVIASEKLSDVLIVSSSAQRTRETTNIVLRSSGVKAKVRFDPEIYEADLPALLEVLSRIEDDRNTVILVGHNPGMEILVRYLTGEPVVMPTAALSKILIDNSSWKGLGDSCGRLEWFTTPNDVE